MRWNKQTDAEAPGTEPAVRSGPQSPEQARTALGERGRADSLSRRRQVGSVATGATAIGTMAIGSLALGALAVGAVAVGAFAIGRLSVGRARIGRAEIGRLRIGTLQIDEISAPSAARSIRRGDVS